MRPSRLFRSPIALAAVCAAVVYSDWPAIDGLDGEGRLRHGYVSELGARGQPHAFAVNALDAAAAATFVALAFELHRLYGVSVQRRIGAAAFGLFGLGAAGGAIFPMDCAPSVSAVCRSAEVRGSTSWIESVHTVASVCEFGGLVASVAVLSLALRREAEWRRVAPIWLAVAPAYAGLAAYVGLRASQDAVVGTSERALVLVSSLWIATVALSVLRRGALTQRTIDGPTGGRGRPAPRTRTLIGDRWG